MSDLDVKKVHFHLPGLFEFVDLYELFLPLFFEHREYFYEWCDIGSVYGAPSDCLWGGGRVGYGDAKAQRVLELMNKYKISPRLTLSNSLVAKEHLTDSYCNKLCNTFDIGAVTRTGVIVASDLLMDYLKEKYPNFYFVSSTTKVITAFEGLIRELDRTDFEYVVPDFRLNKQYEKLNSLSQKQKDKVEFLCNECCDFACSNRKKCYEEVSRMSLGEAGALCVCSSDRASEGYRFSKAMENPGFIGLDDIINKYLPMGFSNFKIEGRSLGSAVVLEFLLYYMTKPQYHLQVREHIYLDSSLDLF